MFVLATIIWSTLAVGSFVWKVTADIATKNYLQDEGTIRVATFLVTLMVSIHLVLVWAVTTNA